MEVESGSTVAHHNIETESYEEAKVKPLIEDTLD